MPVIELLIGGGILLAKGAAAKVTVAGAAKVGEVLGAHALTHGGAQAALLPYMGPGGIITHAIGTGTLGVTSSLHGFGGALSTAGAAGLGGGAGAFGVLVLNECLHRERANLEKRIGKPFTDLLWQGINPQGSGSFLLGCRTCADCEFEWWRNRLRLV